MSADTQQLIQQSLQGDQRAFGQIVERYQGAVSAMAYSVTGNLTQSEDLAQEAFIIAWKKLSALQKHESLAAWLCGIARNLARDWMRTQATRPTVSMEHIAESVQPSGESNATTQFHQERADLVWTALAEIPENYREPLILFYRQGESIRDIAEALELSEDNVRQRLSRGRKLLRAEVARTVEDTLADTRPGKKFTAGVLAALPTLYGAKAGAAEVAEAATTSAKAAAGPAAMGALIKIALPVAVVAGLVLGGIGWRWGLSRWGTVDTPINTERAEVTPVDSGANQGEKTAVLKTAAADVDASGTGTALDPENVDETTSISGVARFRDTGELAPAMKIVAKDVDNRRHETISDTNGSYRFSNLSRGEYTLFAYDARHAEVPWEARRSKDYSATISGEGPPLELDIEVPPLAGVLRGLVTDKATGESIAGIQVVVMRMGEGGIPSGISDVDGKYQVAGIPRGTSLVGLDDFNPVFSNDSPDYMESIVIGDDLAASLDIAVDRGIPVSGHVVDESGQPVPESWINAVLFLSKGQNNWEDCQFKANAGGEFTVWGAHTGDRVVVSARKDELESHITIVTIAAGDSPSVVKLALKPKSSVSGRFVDEQGRPVEAHLWRRPLHPDGAGQWGGSPEIGTTFTLDLPQGQFEIKGQSKQHDFGSESLTQVITVGTAPLKNITVTVASESALVGTYQLSGNVENEIGEPMRRCRVYIRGARITNQGSFQETSTDEHGRFAFEGLLDDFYDVHATPGAPFEDFSGLDGINPTEAPEITIVAGHAPIVRGRVLDAARAEPLTRFDIEIGEFMAPDREFRWITDPVSVNSATGEFEIPARAGKAWYIRVSADGYAPQRITGAPLSTGEQVSVAEITLSSGRAARGTVVDRDGNPVPETQVYLHRGFAEGPRALGKPVTTTDAEGRFTVSSIPDEDEFLYFWKQDFAVTQSPIVDDIHAVLTTGGVIEGRVSVGGLAPDGEFDVIAVIPDTHFVVSAEVNPEGTYRIDKLMKVGYRLQVTLGEHTATSTFYSSEELVFPRIGEAVTFDMDVPTGNGTIQGTVVDKGAAVAGAQLHCRSGHSSTQCSAGDDGAYRFEKLPAGPVTISVYAPGEESTEANPYRIVFETEISANQIIEQDLEWPN